MRACGSISLGVFRLTSVRDKESLETGSLHSWCKVRLRGLESQSAKADFVPLDPISIGGGAGTKPRSLNRTDVNIDVNRGRSQKSTRTKLLKCYPVLVNFAYLSSYLKLSASIEQIYQPTKTENYYLLICCKLWSWDSSKSTSA